MTTGMMQRHENDIDGLSIVMTFGWLRSQELGQLMWPRDAYARTRADRVIRGWLARGLVIARPLPDGAGRAVVLSTTGARMLRDAGEADARTGKDWGAMTNGTWTPDQDWRHDLMAAGVLAWLFVNDEQITVRPEPAIRRVHGSAVDPLAKIPDGLAWTDAGTVYFIEAERARKTGRYQRDLARALISVSAGTCAPVLGRRPTVGLVAYAVGARDDRGMSIDHRTRVTNAIQKEAKQDVRVVWAACTMAGCGVASVALTPETIPADLPSRILRVLEAQGWRQLGEDQNWWGATYGEHKPEIWYDADHGGWWCRIDEGEATVCDNTRTAAKRGCANLLAAIHHQAKSDIKR